MSTSASRKLPAEILAHPEVVALLETGRSTGQVSSDAVRDTSEAAAIDGKHLKALLRLLSEEGVTVVLSAAESTSRKVAAASSSRSTVRASTAKKAPAKKTAAKPAAKKAAAKKDTTEGEESAPAAKKAAKSPAKKSAAKSTAKKTAGRSTAKKAAAEAPAAPVVGPDGKKILPDVPDEQFEKDLATDPTLKEDEDETKGFVISQADDTDEPVQQVMVAGATADPVKDYLKQIGKVPLLNAEMEVELAKRIEAGLFADEKLAAGTKLSEK
ncbi:MAG TPA: sigma-70 factor domain-containing protein, partial [Nocardioidaceae bacterium]